MRRNRQRFPDDFMFKLTPDEARRLRSQISTFDAAPAESVEIGASGRAVPGRGAHRKYRPYAFTEQGLAMLSCVLRSSRAVQVNIEIMRTFVRLREMLQCNAELARKLAALEQKYDGQFRVVFDAIRQLMAPPSERSRRIGFRSDRGD